MWSQTSNLLLPKITAHFRKFSPKLVGKTLRRTPIRPAVSVLAVTRVVLFVAQQKEVLG